MKLRAIENLRAAGIDVVLVVTVVNGVNNDQVGPIVEFAIDNADKVTVVWFQPVSFTGRDEDIDDERRAAQRYTLSHLAHDVHDQLGVTEPLRDWFPLSAMDPFSDVVDLAAGRRAPSWARSSAAATRTAASARCCSCNKTHQADGARSPSSSTWSDSSRDLQDIADAGRGTQPHAGRARRSRCSATSAPSGARRATASPSSCGSS